MKGRYSERQASYSCMRKVGKVYETAGNSIEGAAKKINPKLEKLNKKLGKLAAKMYNNKIADTAVRGAYVAGGVIGAATQQYWFILVSAGLGLWNEYDRKKYKAKDEPSLSVYSSHSAEKPQK